MLFKRHFVLFLVYTVSSCNSEQDDCSKQGPIIPVNESDGGGLDSPGFFKTNSNASINGTHSFFGQELDNMTYNIMEPNGTVEFNSGSLEIAVFKTAELAGGYFLYDTNYTTNKKYTMNQINHVTNLLNKSSVNITLTNITVMTWENYCYCDERESITFQLVLASDSTRTFALLLYNGTENDQTCNPPVETGFKADGILGKNYLPPLQFSRAKSILKSSNMGMEGVYIYQINDPREPISALIPVCGRNRNINTGAFNGIFHYDDGNITINNDGSVEFNNGVLKIAVFQTNFVVKGDTYYDLKDDDSECGVNQTQHVEKLLERAQIKGFNIADLFVITWADYHYCDNEEITFQLVFASNTSSDSSYETTYMLLLYNGTDCSLDCNPPVVTGLKEDESFYNLPLLRHSNAKSVLRTGNAGTRGVFIYKIDDIPQPINDVSNCDCNITDLKNITNGTYEVTTSDSGCWASYQCNSGYTGNDINIISGKDIEIMCTNGNWSGEPPTCEAIDLLIPYTGDYFDMILRRQRTGYNVKHMISPQPPFEKELMRLFIYDNGAVSFGNRLGRGSPNITATGNLSFENVEVNFFVNPSNRQLSIRRDQILNLLKRNETEGAERFNPKNMVVVTWTNVRLTTCDKLIRFQIALVSGDLSGNEKTYALLINNLGEGCEIQYTINGGKDLPKVHKEIKLERNAAYVYAFQ